MDIINKISIIKESFIVCTKFYYKNKLVEMITNKNSDSTSLFQITENGVDIFNLDFFDLKSIIEKHRRLENLILSKEKKINIGGFSSSFNPVIIFKENVLLNIGFEKKDRYISFDNTFRVFMKCDTFINGIKEMLSIISNFRNRSLPQKIIVNDAVIFEEYLMIDSFYCKYYGFIDNENPEVPQEIFKVPLIEFIKLLKAIIFLNDLLHEYGKDSLDQKKEVFKLDNNFSDKKSKTCCLCNALLIGDTKKCIKCSGGYKKVKPKCKIDKAKVTSIKEIEDFIAITEEHFFELKEYETIVLGSNIIDELLKMLKNTEDEALEYKIMLGLRMCGVEIWSSTEKHIRYKYRLPNEEIFNVIL